MYSQSMTIPISSTDGANADKIHYLREADRIGKSGTGRFRNHRESLENRINELLMELEKRNQSLYRTVKAREEIEIQLHNIVGSLSTGILVADLRGKIIVFNREAERITGLKASRVLGRRVAVTEGLTFLEEGQCKWHSLLEKEQNVEEEMEILRKGEDPAHINVKAAPMRSPGGGKIGMIMTLHDITRMKRLEKQANRSDRLAAMGEMAVKIAHEIRNPLGSIELFASTLKEDLENSPSCSAVLDHILTGVRSIDTIVTNMLLFVRPHQRTEFDTVSIHEVIEDSLRFSNHLVKSNEGVEVDRCYCAQPLRVLGDPELLKQVFLNLILNALQAMPKGGRLTIYTRRRGEPRYGQKLIEIALEDTGTGIAEKDMHKIFNPFFTTRDGGTGLGLAIVHNIVNAHNGNIEIRNRSNKGTRCSVSLPEHQKD